jgi:hypothetical protein
VSVRGYIYREGGLYRGHVEHVDRFHDWNHQGKLVPVASVGGYSPHFVCTHCSGVYVKIGQDIVKCETPDACVLRPLHVLDRRKIKRPWVQPGPMGRGLL